MLEESIAVSNAVAEPVAVAELGLVADAVTATLVGGVGINLLCCIVPTDNALKGFHTLVDQLYSERSIGNKTFRSARKAQPKTTLTGTVSAIARPSATASTTPPILGELVYAYVICQMDIRYAVCFLARFSDAPHEAHINALKHVC